MSSFAWQKNTDSCTYFPSNMEQETRSHVTAASTEGQVSTSRAQCEQYVPQVGSMVSLRESTVDVSGPRSLPSWLLLFSLWLSFFVSGFHAAPMPCRSKCQTRAARDGACHHPGVGLPRPHPEVVEAIWPPQPSFQRLRIRKALSHHGISMLNVNR
jgi:hypothetical protein